jgi:hypothetical protein
MISSRRASQVWRWFVYTRVIVPLDDSTTTLQVLPYAKVVAKSTGAAVVLLQALNEYPCKLIGSVSRRELVTRYKPPTRSVRILRLNAMTIPLRFLRLMALGLLLPAALTLGACSGADVPPSTAPDTSTSDTTPSTPDADDAPTGKFWRTDIAVGNGEHQVSPATPVLLADGSTATLESLAGGKPLLLYFYATW